MPLIRSASPFLPLTADDLADIDAMFHQSARDRAVDERDLRHAAQRTNDDAPLSFCLRSVFPSNIR